MGTTNLTADSSMVFSSISSYRVTLVTARSFTGGLYFNGRTTGAATVSSGTNVTAANTLYPDRLAQKAKRQPYLTRIKQIVERTTKPGVPALVALAQTEYETGNSNAAMIAWKRAVDLAPNNGLLRQQYAAWLEDEELDEPLVSELEWLRQYGYGGPNIADRIDVARHALDLKQTIDK